MNKKANKHDWLRKVMINLNIYLHRDGRTLSYTTYTWLVPLINVCGWYLVILLKQTLILDWKLSKNIDHTNKCFKEVGLCFQFLLIAPHSKWTQTMCFGYVVKFSKFTDCSTLISCGPQLKSYSLSRWTFSWLLNGYIYIGLPRLRKPLKL